MKKQHPWLTPLLWVWYLYADGFKKMTLGRKLWAIILIKLVNGFLPMRADRAIFMNN